VVFTGSHPAPKDPRHSGQIKPTENPENSGETVTRKSLRRTAPIAAALALGGGAGAAIYAASSGSGSGQSTVVASVPAQPASTRATTTTLTQLYKNAAPGVVDITVASSDSSSFGQGGQSQAEGSGFVIDTNGDIVTNQHVVAGATSIKVRFQDGTVEKATLVGTDPSTDVAVIKVSGDSSLLHPLTFGDSSSLQVGDEVAAIGSPFGLPESMTRGIVSALNRTITAPNKFSISGSIQTDAAINHGNSGGPLLNMSGQVIGVNAQIESDSGGNDGVGFSIPSDAVKSVANTLIAGQAVQHAYLGVQIGDSPSGTGAVVSTVKADTPASKAGLKAGDVITAIDGDPVANADDLTAKINAHKPSQKVTLSVERGGKSLSIDVTLGVRPS
jgi:putative serine protease PepD